MTTDDAELLRRLGALAMVADPVPASVRDLGRASFGLRRLDAALAELVGDSGEAPPDLHAADERRLTFETRDLSIEAQVATEGGARTVAGSVCGVGPSVGVVQIESAYDCQGRVILDELGGFRFEDLPAITVRIVVTLPSREPVATRWFAL